MACLKMSIGSKMGAVIAKVVTLALMRHILKADGSISGHLGLMGTHLNA